MPAYSGKVYSFDHNWTDPVIERLSWLTDVLRMRSGKEQRIKIRQKPRRTFEYTALIGGQDELDQRRRFDALFYGGQNEPVMVPFWTDAFELSAQLNSGSGSLNTLPKLNGYDIDADNYLMFWRDYRTYEVVQILAVTAQGPPGQVNFVTDTVNTWPVGTRVVPARLCIHAPSVNGEMFATDIKATKAVFELIVPASTAANNFRAVTPTLDTYRSTDVLLNPGLDGSNAHAFERTMQLLDFKTGPFHYDSIQAGPFGTIDCNFELNGRTEISEFLGWLRSRAGRFKGFWVPTWEKDFAPVVSTAADEFTAASFGYTANYNLVEGRRDVAFINANGTASYRRLTASSDDGTLETFQTDTNLPSLTNLERTSFLRYCRLDHDEVELTWQTNDDVSVALKFRELIKTA